MTLAPPTASHYPARAWAAPAALLGRHPVALLWAAWSAVLVLTAWPVIVGFRTQDPDDFLRLMEVRDLLAGQSWFDVTQYRMDPPHGAAMHWSRLVDLPIAAALLAARSLFAEPLASKVAMTVVPLGQLLLVMQLMWRLVAEIGADQRMRSIAVAIVPLFPLLFSTFAPMRIDHHGWQAVAALATATLFVRAPDGRSALIGGAVAALWLSISLEGLPLVVLFAGLYGLRYFLFGERDVAGFLTGLAGASVVACLLTRPASELLPHCDSIGWPHLAAFGAAALLAQAAIRYRGDARAVRLLCLGGIGAVAGALIVAPIGICAVNPFATIDPVMERYWHGVIFEGLPVTAQILSVRIVLLWTLPILFAAVLVGLPDRGRPFAERRWTWMALLTAGTMPVALLVMREGVNVSILVVPFSMLLIARALPRVRAIRPLLPRVLATVALPLAATPTLVSAVVKRFDDTVTVGARAELGTAETAMLFSDAGCDLNALAAMPPGHIFTTLDLGPETLVKSPHTVVASGYHRNMAKMREVVEAFSGDPAHAPAIVRANHARYVVLCPGGGDTTVFRSRRPDNLANMLAESRVPAWLEPVPVPGQGSLRVYRLR